MPARVEDISATEEVILIVWRFPLLGEKSRFDPHEPLIKIPYWEKRLRPKITMPDGGERECRFLILQDCCPVHGSNLDQAHSNQGFLCGSEQLPEFANLIRCQIEQSERLLLDWADWLKGGSPRRQLIVVTNPDDPVGESRISEIADKTELQVATPLGGVGTLNHRLMDQIEKGLLRALGH